MQYQLAFYAVGTPITNRYLAQLAIKPPFFICIHHAHHWLDQATKKSAPNSPPIIAPTINVSIAFLIIVYAPIKVCNCASHSTCNVHLDRLGHCGKRGRYDYRLIVPRAIKDDTYFIAVRVHRYSVIEQLID